MDAFAYFSDYTDDPETLADMAETYALLKGMRITFRGRDEAIPVASPSHFSFLLGAALFDMDRQGKTARDAGWKDVCSHLRRMAFATPDLEGLASGPQDMEELTATFCDVMGRDIVLAAGTVKVTNEANFAIALGIAFREAHESGRPVRALVDACADMRRLSVRPQTPAL